VLDGYGVRTVTGLADQAHPARDDRVLVRLLRRTEVTALDQHPPLVGPPEPGQRGGERALAGPVPAEQPVDLPRRETQIEPVQRGHTGEPNREILGPDSQGGGHQASP
jgi:hypothetical protein